MKVERMGGAERRPPVARPLCAPGRGGAPAGATPCGHRQVLGIPEAEFTPRVRDAIMGLMGEVDILRRELNQTRARLEEAGKAADQDQLLPLFNRRAFVRELTRYIAFAGRYGTPASLIYFDLDGFKAVNDTYGHAAGDAVLAHFADVLLAHCATATWSDGWAATSSASSSPMPRAQAPKKAEPGRDARAPPALERPDHPVELRLWRVRAEARRQCRHRDGPRRRSDVRAKALWRTLIASS